MAWIGTNDLLEGEEVWTSPAIKTNHASSVRGIVFSDADGSLSIEFSANGEDWDLASSPIAVTGGTGESFNEPVVAPFVRLVYTNDTDDQEEFRLTANTYTYA